MFIVFSSLAFIPPPNAQCKHDIKDRLYGEIQVDIRWDGRGYSSSQRRVGSLNMTVLGELKLAAEWSAAPWDLGYTSQSMIARYTIKDKLIDLDPGPGCPEIIYDISGKDSKPISYPWPFLKVRYLGTLARQKKPVLGPGTSGFMFDYYSFGMHPLPIRAEGKKRKGTFCFENDCPCRKYDPYMKEFHPMSVGMHFVLGENGKMAGKRSWTSGSEPVKPECIELSDLPPKFGCEPYRPPKRPKGVHYSVRWRIDKAPLVMLLRQGDDGRWEEITDQAQAVVVGEKIILKGVVLPEKLDPKHGKWQIIGKTIKKFEANNDRGKKVELTDQDKTKNAIEFYWYDEASGLDIGYSTEVEGEKMSAKATFNIKRPGFRVEVDALDHSSFFPAGFKNEPTGLYYADRDSRQDGIVFVCQDLDLPGDLQWVQLIEEETYSTQALWAQYPGDKTKCTGKGLDTRYPMEPGKKASDHPGLPEHEYLSHREAKATFQTYLMFRPTSRRNDSEWVPLSRTKWWWRGAIKRDENQKTKKVYSKEASHIRPEDTTKYPEWLHNITNADAQTCTEQ